MMAVLEKQEGNSNSVDCTNLMSEARIIKTPWEIDVQRLAAILGSGFLIIVPILNGAVGK